MRIYLWMTTTKAICVALCAILTMFLLAWLAMEASLHPDRRPILPADESRVQNLALESQAVLENVQITAADGAILRAWNLHPQKNNGNAVILYHGVTDNRLAMTGNAEIFLRHGYDVVMPDARAHGTSGGDLATFGLLESNDAHRWLDWLESHDHPTCIYGFAESMGAAGLLQSLPSETRFCAVAAESPFSSFREVAHDRFGQFFHTGPWLGRTLLRPVVDFSFLYAKWKYKLDFEPDLRGKHRSQYERASSPHSRAGR